MWNLKNKRKITKLTDTENTWVVTRGRGWGMGSGQNGIRRSKGLKIN